MEAPAIESWVIPETGMEAVVHMTVPVVAAIDAGVVVAAAKVRTRIISMAAKITVRTLHVSAAMGADVHHARSVMHPDHCAPAVQAIADVHAAAVDRSNLSVGTDARGTTTVQRNVPASCRSVTGPAGVSALGCMPTWRAVPALGAVATLRTAPTLGRMPAFRRMSTLSGMPTFGGVAALGGVSALRVVAAFSRVPALRGMSTFRRMAALRCMSALRCVSTTAALWGRVGRGFAATGFVLLLRRSASRSNCGHGEKNQP